MKKKEKLARQLEGDSKPAESVKASGSGPDLSPQGDLGREVGQPQPGAYPCLGS